MSLDPATERLVSAALLRLRVRSPFFATLALFARFQATSELLPALTDGRDVFVNPTILRNLPTAQQDAVLLHTVLHAALRHPARRRERDRDLWNMAADIVVNGMIAAAPGCEPPYDSPRVPELEHYSVEEVYELLRTSPERQPTLSGLDLVDNMLAGSAGDRTASGEREGSSIASSQQAATEAHWRNALQQATVVAEMVQGGSLPAGMARDLNALEPGHLDWRAHLWRYLVQTPTDFQGYDRRFVGRRLYLEALTGESVRVFVAVDTSGSVNAQQVQTLVSEVQGILRTYPHLRCDLYYADDQIYGPHALAPDSPIPTPVGGGGTDFQPFFQAVAAAHTPHEQAVCVYLTDGYGMFPHTPPDLPTLWVLTPGGRDLAHLPFGEGVRLTSMR